MENILLLSAIVGAFLIGSIPSAVWIGRILYGCDVRNFGSGNAGATNTFRVLGRSAGIVVTLMDIAKGMAAAGIASLLLDNEVIALGQLTLFQIILGVTAITGHIFPVFADFRGGKGVATMVGMLFTIKLEIALICIAIFFAVLIASKYVSLGSILASLAFPLLLMVPGIEDTVNTETILVSFSLFVIVVLTHIQNIKRMLAGNESKSVIRLRSKKNTERED